MHSTPVKELLTENSSQPVNKMYVARAEDHDDLEGHLPLLGGVDVPPLDDRPLSVRHVRKAALFPWGQ